MTTNGSAFVLCLLGRCDIGYFKWNRTIFNNSACPPGLSATEGQIKSVCPLRVAVILLKAIRNRLRASYCYLAALENDTSKFFEMW